MAPVVGVLAAIGGGSAVAGGALALGTAATVGSVISSQKQAKEAKKANQIQQAEIAKAEKAQAEQDKLTAEQTAREDSNNRKRAIRLSKGRTGLLYQGNETGVQSQTLGG